MKPVQRIAFSLLISVVVFSAFAVLAFSGLFSYIETEFYNKRVTKLIEYDLERLSNGIERYHADSIQRFSAVLAQDFISRVYLPNQSREDIFQISNTFNSLLAEYPGIQGIRIVDERMNVHFSTYPQDIKKREEYRISYNRFPDVEPGIPEEELAFGEGETSRIIHDAENRRILFIFRIRDPLGRDRGSGFFAVSLSDLKQYLVQNALIDLGKEIALVDRRGYLTNLPSGIGFSELASSISTAWAWTDAAKGRKIEPIPVTYSDSAYYVFSRYSGACGFVGILVNSSQFTLQEPLKYLLLSSLFITSFLITFLLFSLRQDKVVILSERIRRFQIGFLKSYMESKKDLDLERWRADLRTRGDEVKNEIRKGLGRVKDEKKEQIDEMIDQSWNELIEIVDRRIESRTTARIDISNIEEIIAAVISRGGLPGKTSELAPTADQDTAVKAVEVVTKAPKGVSPQPKKKTESIRQAAGIKEEPEELAEIEEVEAVEEAEELEEAAGVTEVEEVEEVEELAEEPALEEAEPAAEAVTEEIAEEAEELGEAEELEEAAGVTEVEEVEEVEELAEEPALEEAEPAAEAVTEEIAEEAEELGEAEAFAEVEEIRETPPVEMEPKSIIIGTDGVLKERTGVLELPVEIAQTAQEDREEIEELGLVVDTGQDIYTLEKASGGTLPFGTFSRGFSSQFLYKDDRREAVEELVSLGSGEEAAVLQELDGEEYPERESDLLSSEVCNAVDDAERTGEESKADGKPAEPDMEFELEAVEELGEAEGIEEIEEIAEVEEETVIGDAEEIGEVPPPAASAKGSESRISILRRLGKIEVHEIAEYLGTPRMEKPAVEEEGGVFSVREDIIHGQGKPKDSKLKELVDSVVSEPAREAERKKAEISDILGLQGVDLDLDDLMGSDADKPSTEDNADARVLSFGDSGLDLDAYFKGFRSGPIGIMRALMNISRKADALYAAVLEFRDAETLEVEYSLGLDMVSRKTLRFIAAEELFSMVFKEQRILYIRLPKTGIPDVDGKISPRDLQYLQGSLFLPARFKNDRGYFFLGLKRNELEVNDHIDALIG